MTSEKELMEKKIFYENQLIIYKNKWFKGERTRIIILLLEHSISLLTKILNNKLSKN